MTLADYDRTSWKRAGDALRQLAERERVVLPWAPDVLDVLQEEQRRQLAERERVVLPSRPTCSTSCRRSSGASRPVTRCPPASCSASRTSVCWATRRARASTSWTSWGSPTRITARLQLDSRGRPGHEKNLPGEWVVARFTAPEALPPAALTPDSQRRVLDARAALRCGPLQDVLHAVEGPLGWREVARNLRTAARLTAIRLPADPSEARELLCGPTTPT